MKYSVIGSNGDSECRAPDKLAMRDCDNYEAGEKKELYQCKHWRFGFCWAVRIDGLNPIITNKPIPKECNMSNTNAVQKTADSAPVAVAPNAGERFVAVVTKEFGCDGIDERRKKLIQGYFMTIDRVLKAAEKSRSSKNNLTYTWDNVNLSTLARDIVVNARMGLDMTLPNHLFPIPYKNKELQKYDVTLMKGYNGIVHVAEKYALNKPKNVTIELVHQTDHFKPLKKSKDTDVESYEFDIKVPFKRGNIIGGFGYIEFDDPTKNKLVLMSLEAIEKRKPKNPNPEFWGGTKTVTEWVDNKPTDKVVTLAGWVEEMYLKVLKREVYSGKYIPIDPEKIDDNYQAMVARELDYAKLEAEAEIDENANAVPIAEVAPSAPVEQPTEPVEPF